MLIPFDTTGVSTCFGDVASVSNSNLSPPHAPRRTFPSTNTSAVLPAFCPGPGLVTLVSQTSCRSHGRDRRSLSSMYPAVDHRALCLAAAYNTDVRKLFRQMLPVCCDGVLAAAAVHRFGWLGGKACARRAPRSFQPRGSFGQKQSPAAYPSTCRRPRCSRHSRRSADCGRMGPLDRNSRCRHASARHTRRRNVDRQSAPVRHVIHHSATHYFAAARCETDWSGGGRTDSRFRAGARPARDQRAFAVRAADAGRRGTGERASYSDGRSVNG